MIWSDRLTFQQLINRYTFSGHPCAGSPVMNGVNCVIAKFLLGIIEIRKQEGSYNFFICSQSYPNIGLAAV